MSTVRHPVGPEPEQTYWVRRLLVIAAAVLLVGLVIALLVGGTSTGTAVSAQPVPPPLGAPSPVTATPTLFASPSPTPSASASSTDPASPAPSGSASASATASASASATPSPATKAEGKSASPSPSAKPSNASKAGKAGKAAPAVCSPRELRATLTGKRQLRPEQGNTFKLSLINGSGATCIVEVEPADFELKIYSGTDRIWSTADCGRAVKPVFAKVQAEDAVTWTMRWNGRRSAKGCETRPEIPRPGTYFATAQVDGAKPVQLRMILRG